MAEPTATVRVYAGVYAAILEQRVVPGMRLREDEMATRASSSTTLIGKAAVSCWAMAFFRKP